MRLAASLLLVLSCYSQPRITRDHALACASNDVKECPTGFVCVAGVCAPRSCRVDEDCPTGLSCSTNRSCVAPRDAGADATSTEAGGN